jgi:hypothetical protein
MRSLVSLVVLGVMAALPVDSRAAQATLRCPQTLRDAHQLPVDVTIDVGTTPLGAYSVTVTYDAAVLAVVSVAGGTTTEFAGTPTTSTPAPRTANIAALQTTSLSSPTGSVSVAKINFDVVGTASTPTVIGLAVNHLFDTNGTGIVRATGTGCSIPADGGRTDHHEHTPTKR